MSFFGLGRGASDQGNRRNELFAPPAPRSRGPSPGGGNAYDNPPPAGSRDMMPGYGSDRYREPSYREPTESYGGGYGQPPPQQYPQRRSDGLPRGPRQAPQHDDGYGGAPTGSAIRRFDVVQMPTDEDARSNRLILHPEDYKRFGPFVKAWYVDEYRQEYDRRAFTTRPGNVQPGSVGASLLQRKWMGVPDGASRNINIQSLDRNEVYSSKEQVMDISIGLKDKTKQLALDVDELVEFIRDNFREMLFTPGQIYLIHLYGYNFRATVQDSNAGGKKSISAAPEYALLRNDTPIIIHKEPGSQITLKASAVHPPSNAILAPNFKFEDVGIGGLDAEFSAIFRRAFASRMFPRGLVDKLGIRHVKGLLLYGPPGTGKTLMARQIGKMLNAREPKIVNGPEILSKYVGASEENVRKLFSEAEKEYKEKGDESELHIIIFDELDAITKQRGSTNSGTGVGDTVVNQLLSKMDGVDQLNNILIIGMTNRKDMIDEALLRPGRLEVHVEISLPDESGRLQILSIHTAKMTRENVMDKDVSLAELAALTKNFSGAEIEGLVKSATSFAFQRHIKVGTTAGLADDVQNLRVNRNDFMLALEEVHPAFGVSEEELQGLVQNGIVHYDESVENILQNARILVEQVRTSTRTPLVSVLLHGLPGTGKTALAATIAQNSEYPFIKLVSPDKMVGFSEQAKVQAINKIFSDSYKSPLSVIVVDNIERLIDWVKIGSRFSNAVVQTLMVLMGRRPPMGRRLLILATTSNRAMVEELEMAELFDAELRIGPVTSMEGLEKVLDEAQLIMDKEERRETMVQIETAFRPVTRDEQAVYGETKLSIGIKKLLGLIEMARLDQERVGERLVGSLIEASKGAASSAPVRKRRGAGGTEDGMSPGYYPGITM